MILLRGFAALAEGALAFRSCASNPSTTRCTTKHLGVGTGSTPDYVSHRDCMRGCEDLVGKTARLSRRVSTRQFGRRVLERVFLKTRAVFRKHIRVRRQQGKRVR